MDEARREPLLGVRHELLVDLHLVLGRDHGLATPRVELLVQHPPGTLTDPALVERTHELLALRDVDPVFTDVRQAAVDALRAQGLAVSGPAPADSLFHARAREGYDAVLCMYHDQALIPLKTLEFDEGVNVTLGLPIIRTSPDHGTAFDIAGKGLADPSAMIAAIRLAGECAARRDAGENRSC